MPFSWTTDPDAGDKILAADITEIRKNADWIKDNLVCVTHNTTYYATHDVGYDAALNNTHKNAIQSVDNATYYTTDDVGQKATHNTGHNTPD